MGGQACILYGAAEFSRDLDLVLAADPAALTQLQTALNELQAERIAVPPLDLALLERGHGVHFRCHRTDVANLRLDILTHPPRVDDVPGMWTRRVIIPVPGGEAVPVIALPDLIETKKTQRDKDWAMIGSLIDADIVRHQDTATDTQVLFWLQSARNADQLIEFATMFPTLATAAMMNRPLLADAIRRDHSALELGLAQEQIRGKAADRAYWAPRLAELEAMRWQERREL